MTHDELKTKLLISDETSIYETLRLFQQALFSIVKLHKSYSTSEGITFCTICTRTEEIWEYPCETIKAIEKELA
jgi:hypothetical protein